MTAARKASAKAVGTIADLKAIASWAVFPDGRKSHLVAGGLSIGEAMDFVTIVTREAKRAEITAAELLVGGRFRRFLLPRKRAQADLAERHALRVVARMFQTDPQTISNNIDSLTAAAKGRTSAGAGWPPVARLGLSASPEGEASATSSKASSLTDAGGASASPAVFSGSAKGGKGKRPSPGQGAHAQAQTKSAAASGE